MKDPKPQYGDLLPIPQARIDRLLRHWQQRLREVSYLVKRRNGGFFQISTSDAAAGPVPRPRRSARYRAAIERYCRSIGPFVGLSQSWP